VFVRVDLGQVMGGSLFRVDSINENAGGDESFQTGQVAVGSSLV